MTSITQEEREACDHDWVEVESMFSNEYLTEVRCLKCGVSGERDESDGTVFWPAT
jgi:hypothetical protein